MPVTFGSVGDIIAVVLVVKDLVDALDRSRGAAAEYQDIIRELRCLDRSLIEVERLSREFSSSSELQALSRTAQQIVEKCQKSVEAFQSRIKKYKISLRDTGSGSLVKDTARKVQWQWSQSNELAKFRVEVIAHYSSINSLVATAQLHLLELKDKQLKEKLTEEAVRGANVAESHSAAIAKVQKQVEDNNFLLISAAKSNGSTCIFEALRFKWLQNMGSDLRQLMQKTYLLNIAIHKALMSMQGLFPSYLERTLIQEPFILEDAIGRIVPVHLQFIPSWDAFDDVIEHRFRGFQGHEMILQKLWVLQEMATRMDINRPTPWAAAFLPGQRIGMDLIFSRQDGDSTVNICPSCKTRSEEICTGGVRCASCGMHYLHRVIELLGDSEGSFMPADNENETNLDGFNTRRKRRHEDKISEDHPISSFKRVRIITEKYVGCFTSKIGDTVVPSNFLPAESEHIYDTFTDTHRKYYRCKFNSCQNKGFTRRGDLLDHEPRLGR